MWKKSSYTLANNNCAEWRTASFTLANNNCAQQSITDYQATDYAWTLEDARRAGVPEENLAHSKVLNAVAEGEQLVLLRTSTNKHNALAFTIGEWQAFLKGVKAGEFDLAPEDEDKAEAQLAAQTG